ncbi:hypothetical protein K3G63_03495 [Hymenobacter sp. HSC-4F20]|uniref:hypothetical protein n=1 Tax=Hymenobacter sp. HSC-4F20 TaxID=2864135 RepID=UPI001C737E34|nr:hypothetical protein [Hymenobacter sp. HSC-4F20]MBX0289484.1 hypothetical protein [Hymenobacter sp. HSC-4F20]
MLEIQLYLRKHWGEVEQFSGNERFFSIADKLAILDYYSMSPNLRYNYGRVVIKDEFRLLLDEECELDFFISCIQDDKDEIFSGKTHVIDNSYFKMSFHYHDKLKIGFGQKNITVSKKEFIDAFRTTAETYYLMLAEVKEDREYYEQQAQQVRTEWQYNSRAS